MQNPTVIGFHHPGIVVPSLDRAIEFYSALLGFVLHSESSWTADNERFNRIIGLPGAAARYCLLRGANAYIELFEYSKTANEDRGARQANEMGIRHIAFAVQDVQEMIDCCVRLGGSKIEDAVVVPGRATAAYCRDPFGNLLEFVEPRGAFPQAITR